MYQIAIIKYYTIHIKYSLINATRTIIHILKNLLIAYKNGKNFVIILKSGTKIRLSYGNGTAKFPETIDLKITDYCDAGCSYCHESSTVNGKHANYDHLISVLSQLPKGVEIAIGGGNPLSYPNLIDLLEYCKRHKLIANITINQAHVNRYKNLIEDIINRDLVYGIGISVVNVKTIHKVDWIHKLSKNVIYHVILGVTPIDDLSYFINYNILILGYKNYGFGKTYLSNKNNQIEQNIHIWKEKIKFLLFNYNLSFDNLAIEQLDLKSKISDKLWSKCYMGNDGEYSMYFDAVSQTFAKNSTSPVRQPSDVPIEKFFKHINFLVKSTADCVES